MQKHLKELPPPSLASLQGGPPMGALSRDHGIYHFIHLPSASVCTDGGILQVGAADPDGSSSC